MGFYHSRPLRRLIAELKFGGVTSLNLEVERFLLDRAASFGWEFPWQDAPMQIQPIPLSSSRIRERGFNQSHTIALRMREAWLPHAEIMDVLERLPGAPAQATIDHELRASNIKGAFVARRRIEGSILLVDDVVTTGSTAAEGARCLLGAGADQVYLATLAIGM